MNVRKAALIAEIIGGIGVIVSLLFLAFQVKSNSAVLAAQAVLQLRESNSLMARDLITDDELADVVYRGYEDYEALSDFERWRFEFWVTEVLTHRMTAWKYAQQGLLDPEEVQTWQASTCGLLALPSARLVWDKHDPWIRPDFRADVERVCSQIDAIVPAPFR